MSPWYGFVGGSIPPRSTIHYEDEMSELQKWLASFAVMIGAVTILAILGFLISTYPGIMFVFMIVLFLIAIAGIIKINFFE